MLHFWRHHQGVAGYVGGTRDGSFWFCRHHSDDPAAAIDLPTMTAPLRNTPVRQVLDDSWVSPPIGLYQLDPSGIWHKRHTVLIGDAAHVLSPAVGRGATAAIEDAILPAKHCKTIKSTRRTLWNLLPPAASLAHSPHIADAWSASRGGYLRRPRPKLCPYSGEGRHVLASTMTMVSRGRDDYIRSSGRSQRGQ